MFTVEELFDFRKIGMRVAVSSLFRAVPAGDVKKIRVRAKAQSIALERKRYHQRFVAYQRSIEKATSQYS